MRVLVCGGRDFKDADLLKFALNIIKELEGIDLIIHGHARGADSMAAVWAVANGIDNLGYFADWKTHGKAAGPIRNQKMLDDGRPDLVIAFPGGPGTADMVRRARLSGVEVREIN